MINFEMTKDEALFLLGELTKERKHVEIELVHTDKRSMQADIAKDLKRLESLVERLARATGTAAPAE